MSNSITHRTALAVPAALPLMPMAALTGANAQSTSHFDADDPVIPFFREWELAYRAEHDACSAFGRIEDQRLPRDVEDAYYERHVVPTHNIRTEVEQRIATVTACGAIGLVMQLRVALANGIYIDPARYEADDSIAVSAIMVCNMLVAAEHIAGASS
jgi:hypothetical protein